MTGHYVPGWGWAPWAECWSRTDHGMSRLAQKKTVLQRNWTPYRGCLPHSCMSFEDMHAPGKCCHLQCYQKGVPSQCRAPAKVQRVGMLGTGFEARVWSPCTDLHCRLLSTPLRPAKKAANPCGTARCPTVGPEQAEAPGAPTTECYEYARTDLLQSKKSLQRTQMADEGACQRPSQNSQMALKNYRHRRVEMKRTRNLNRALRDSKDHRVAKQGQHRPGTAQHITGTWNQRNSRRKELRYESTKV